MNESVSFVINSLKRSIHSMIRFSSSTHCSQHATVVLEFVALFPLSVFVMYWKPCQDTWNNMTVSKHFHSFLYPLHHVNSDHPTNITFFQGKLAAWWILWYCPTSHTSEKPVLLRFINCLPTDVSFYARETGRHLNSTEAWEHSGWRTQSLMCLWYAWSQKARRGNWNTI